MKNIQVIDGADNCAYSIYGASDGDFKTIFPQEGQDIEFIEDLLSRLDERASDALARRLWLNPVSKPQAVGIHGTLFYEHSSKRKFYQNKRESGLKG